MPETHDLVVDVVIIGATPGGIAAAVSAARLGRRVLLAEYQRHPGGMAASGLGKSDIEKRDMIGGLFREFVQRVKHYYLARYGADSPNIALCRDGYYYEPSVAETIFKQMLAGQPSISLLLAQRLDAVAVNAEGAVTGATIIDRDSNARRHCRAQVFIDATYEGDLYAGAGADYRLGREARAEFGEPHAGVVYFDYERGCLLPGSTHDGDDRLPAYTYRLCLSSDPANSFRLETPPPEYQRETYLPYLEDLQAGRLGAPAVFKDGRGYNAAHFNTLVRALSITDIPNRKTDVNINPRPLAFPFGEENSAYVEAGWPLRERICERHRNLTLGLLYFLQNDDSVPPAHREIAGRYHLPLDEFTDNAHFPFQLYVREARRLCGEYTLTEHDITTGDHRSGQSRHRDAIAVGEFPIDSFPVRKKQPGDSVVLEGYLGMLDGITRAYQIPYRIIIPKRIDGLIVPVAASTSHVAYSSIRMEPTWMALGQAAGVAAHLSIEHGVQARDVPIDVLQQMLAKQGQVMDLAAEQSTG